MSTENSRWIRSANIAERPDDGGRVMESENGWIYVLGKKMKRLLRSIDHAGEYPVV